MVEIQQKKCDVCNEPLDDKHSHKNNICGNCLRLQKNIKYREYYKKNKELIKKKHKEYYENNKEKLKPTRLSYRENNKDVIKEKRKVYYEENKESCLNACRNWEKNNKEYYNKYRREKARQDRIDRPYYYAWRDLLKRMVRRYGTKKEKSTLEMLGYSFEDLKLYIQEKFTEGMSWDNYGEWELHHIKFVSEFDENTPPSVVNALDNLIPLWKDDHKKIHYNYGLSRSTQQSKQVLPREIQP